MKAVLVLLLCWSSLALAVGALCEAGDPGLPHSLEGKRTLTNKLPMGNPIASHSTLRGTKSLGYEPWAEQVTGLPDGTGFCGIHAADSNTVWAAVSQTPPTLIRTTDGGTTWICDTIYFAPTNCVATGIYAFDAITAWVSMFNLNTGSGGAIFHTTDGGVTWMQDPIVLPSPDFIHFFDVNNGVCVGEVSNLFVVYTTSNSGATWSRVPQANIPGRITGEYGATLAFCTAGNSFWFFTVYGVQTSLGWKGTGRYYRTTDKGLTWTVHVYPGGAPSIGVILGFQNDNVGLGSRDFGEVSRTTDGGSTWTLVSSPSHLGLFQIEHVPGTSDIFVADAIWKYPSLEGGYIYGTAYSTDGGANWTGACALNAAWHSVDFTSASAGWRADLPGQNIYKWTMAQGRVIGTSVDSLNFVPLAVGQISDTVAIDAVNFGSDPLTVSSIVAPGNHFTVVTQPTLPTLIPPLGSVRVGLRFAPQANGVFQDSLVFVSNAVNAQSTSVYLTGKGGTSAVEPTAQMPNAFALLQSYPNPFNPSTTIKYELPKSSDVRLTVYDMLGREVSVLVNERRAAGVHEVQFDASGLSSGMYFYRIQAGDFVSTKRMLFVK